MLFCNVDLILLIELQVCQKSYEKEFWIQNGAYLFSFYQNVNAIAGWERTRTHEGKRNIKMQGAKNYR
jgi:hypothetical protein